MKKNKGGRPLKFKTPEKLQEKIDAYFRSCYEIIEEKDKKGNVVKTITRNIRPLTITGLAVALKTSRETLINYENRDEFFDAIKGAKDIIHNFAEEFLYNGKNVAGAIFNLKNNYGWKDKQEIEQTITQVNDVLDEIEKK